MAHESTRAVSTVVFGMRPIAAQIAMKTVRLYQAATGVPSGPSDLRSVGQVPDLPSGDVFESGAANNSMGEGTRERNGDQREHEHGGNLSATLL